MNFSLIIPCYNEEKNLTILIKKYKKFLNNKKNELILVNNGSTDNTEYVLKNFLKIKNLKIIKIRSNIGFGNGLKKGLLAAKGNYLIYAHADLEAEPKDILKSIDICLKNKKKNKIFIKGNRVEKLKNHWTFVDIFFSYSLTIFSCLLFQKKLFDIHAIPVLFSKELIKNERYIPNDFSIDLFFYLIAKKKKYQIIRFPVNFNKKKRKFGIGNSAGIIRQIKESLNQFCGALKIFKNLI